MIVSTQWAAIQAFDWINYFYWVVQDINWSSKYNLFCTTNNIYLTQKQGRGTSKLFTDGGCSGRYSPTTYTNTT